MAHTNRRAFLRKSIQGGAGLWLAARFCSPSPAAEALTLAEFKQIVPVLKVSDLQRAVDFYTTVFGFTVAWRAANDRGCRSPARPFRDSPTEK